MAYDPSYSKNSNNNYLKNRKKQRKHIDKPLFPTKFKCPICYGILNDPVTILDECEKHIFCKECITDWFKILQQNKHALTNPLTNKKLKTQKYKLISHKIYKENIKKWVQKYEQRKIHSKKDNAKYQKIFDENFKHIKSQYSTREWATEYAIGCYDKLVSLVSDDYYDESKEQYYYDMLDKDSNDGINHIKEVNKKCKQQIKKLIKQDASEQDLDNVVQENKEKVGFVTKLWDGINNFFKNIGGMFCDAVEFLLCGFARLFGF